MTGALMLALILESQGKPAQRPPDFSNSQLVVRYLQDVPYSGPVFYSSYLNPYLLSHTFEEYKGPPVNDGVDTKPLTYTITKPGKSGWKFTAPTDTATYKILADGNVVIPYDWRYYKGFTALNAKNGAKLWSRKPVEKVEEGRTAIDLVNGVLYQWDAGHFTATNPQTGDVLWDRSIEGRTKGMVFPPIQVKNGRIYFSLEVDKKACLFCLDARTGAQIWNRFTGVPMVSVGEHHLPGFVVLKNKIVGYEFAKERQDDLQKQSVFCLDINTGEELWKHPIVYTAWPFTPEANEEAVFAGTVRGSSYLLKVSDGTQIVKLELRWGRLFGQYILDIDDKDGLVIYMASSGERIGRIQLTTRTLWSMSFVQDRLMLSHLIDADKGSSCWRTYEVIATK